MGITPLKLAFLALTLLSTCFAPRYFENPQNERSPRFQGKFEKLKDMYKRNRVADFTDESIRSFASGPSNYTIVLLMATINSQVPGADISIQATRHLGILADQYFADLGPKGYNSPKFLENPIFLARCELEKCREAMQDGANKAGWRVVPKLLIIPPRESKGSADVTKWLDMSADPVYHNAAQMAEWISSVTHYPLEVRVPFLELYGNALITIGLVAVIIYGIQAQLKVWLQSKMFWFMGGLGVYCFSMAGVVFNAIHNPPWFYDNPQTKQRMFIYPSARQQFVWEGIIMAAILSSLGLLFAAFAVLVPRMKDNSKRRITFIAIAAAFFFLYQQLFRIFRAKYGWYPF